MREVRATCVQPNLIDVVQPKPHLPVQPKGLIMQGNRISGVTKQSVQVDIPRYNPSIHKAGDRVLMQNPYNKRWQAIIIPELDIDGNPM